MALRRYTTTIDGTIPAEALLYSDEELIGSQDSVGIYDGPQKSPEHQDGIVYVTSHRLFYVDAKYPETRSFALDLAAITQTESFAGLFMSSPKVTIHISSEISLSTQEHPPADNDLGGFDTWECQVCAYRNPPGLSPAAARVCGLCGVPREAIPTTTPGSSSHTNTRRLSASLPSSGLASPSRPSGGSTPISQEQPDQPDPISCPACTFLNYPSLKRCEMCDTQLPRPSRGRKEMKSAPSSRPASPVQDGDPAFNFIRLSFRKGGDKVFYGYLKRALKSKVWEGRKYATNTQNLSGNSRPTRPQVGISGILNTVESSAQGREDNIKDALQDLEALMVKAKDMVRLAAELNEKLTAASTSQSRSVSPYPGSTSSTFSGTPLSSSTTLVSGSEPEEATFIRSSLSQLGLQLDNTPVTQDMMKDEHKWLDELARELAHILQGSRYDHAKKGMMRERGIIALDEAWGGWNRARGVALIPPSTFLQVLPLLPQYTEPSITQRKFASGFTVLHTPPYSRTAFGTRLSEFLVSNGPKTTMDIAIAEGLAIALVREMIEAGEQDGDFCRDDVGEAAISGGGSGTGVEVRWWPNVFAGYVWDVQVVGD
ncbi:vacuolar protein sorting-associated protein 36 [Coprinopsis marcescibilis]|uniref:Vacuolar protein-sorting-associated protein 36 n=1 Tax=Coprinopsis marcescibilis TaxID=230819 RepID=A0A5C3L1W5_COPMA|nr:vacuolar protein sorting-associated protein 36 [Coprinopsis marcescibilis]